MAKGWLDNYNDSTTSAPEGFVGEGIFNGPKFDNPAWGGQFQNGGTKKPITTREDFDPSALSNIPGLTSLASGNQPGYNREEQYGPLGDLYRYYGGQPLEHDVLVESQNKPSTYKDKNAKYISLNHDREFVNEVLDNYERVSSGKLDKGIESKLNDNSWSVSGYSSAGKDAHKTKKQGSEHHSNAIGRYTLGKGKDKKGEYISYYDKFDQGTGDDLNPGEALGLTKPFEIYDRIYLKDVNRKYQMGGNLPGAVGNMYARTGSPSKGPRRNQTDVTDASAQNGKEMQYYQNGLDFKPKSISKNGGWLDSYDVAQEGINLPSVRDLITDTTNRKIQAHKGKGKESKVTQKDNTKTVTPKVDTTKPLTKEQVDARRLLEGLKQNISTDEETSLQERKNQAFKSMQEFYKSPLGSPGYFTPEGAIIGALQGVTKLGPDLYEGNYKAAAMDALMALPIGIPAAKGLGRVLGPEEGLIGKVSQEVNINRNLGKIKKEGQLQGLSDYEIAKKQMEQVGITSNQRKGYTPIVSELAEKYITPYGYTGTNNGTKLSQTINNIKQGGVDINKIDPERLDAWKLYLGRPQVHKTFGIADTAPAIHPSYKPGSLEGMDIYNINSKRVLGDIPEYPSGVSRGRFMDILENPIAVDRERRIMGGYNKVMTKEGTQYNDVWDLDPHLNLKDVVPNKISGNTLLENIFYKTNAQGMQSPRGVTVPVSKVFGKPFMSHGNLPYSSTHYVDDLKLALQGEIESLRPIEHTAWEGPERIKAWEQQIENLKNYPKYEDGGIIKDDRGYWNPDNWGKDVEIDQSDPDSFIDMEGVYEPLLGVSDKGEERIMYPGEKHKFKKGTKKVIESRIAKNGLRQEQKGLQNLDQLTNFTNYNKPTNWLNKYN